jgi:Na+/H+ antiporter NhaD/arsenite permease-like protein
MGDKGVLAIAIFALVYIIILAGENSPRKLDRPTAALIGGVLMVICGVLTRAEALKAIDFGTLALLFGMMVVICPASSAGLLDRIAEALVGHGHSARQMLWIVCLAAGMLSALFVNDTICLIMTPLLLSASRSARLPAEPYLLALATSSNVGSVMTVTGNPQNMLIAQSSGWTWGPFALRMAPVGLACLAINALVLDCLYRRQLQAADCATTLATALPEKRVDRKLAVKTVVVLAGLLIAFLCGAPMDLAALSAAVAMLALINRPPAETFAAVDWALLLFFAGLFVVVQGVTKTEGVWMGRALPMFTHHTGSLQELAGFSAMSVAGSNLFSNVPFVMLVRGWIVNLPHASVLWLMLAASSTFAGNLTLVGSVANLIVAQGAKDECPLSFGSFLKVGVLTTTFTVIASVLMIWLYGRLGWV